MLSHTRRMEVERILVEAYLQQAVKQGWRIVGVDDENAPSGITHVTTVAEAVENVFSYDECHVYVRRPDERISSFSWFWFVLGNEGWTVLSDYTTTLDNVVAAVDPLVETYELEASE